MHYYDAMSATDYQVGQISLSFFRPIIHRDWQSLPLKGRRPCRRLHRLGSASVSLLSLRLFRVQLCALGGAAPGTRSMSVSSVTYHRGRDGFASLAVSHWQSPRQAKR